LRLKPRTRDMSGTPADAKDAASRKQAREMRGMLRGIITADPGVHHVELFGRLGAAVEAAAGLLQALEGEGAIRSRLEGDTKRYYPGGMKLVAPTEALTGLQRLILKTVQSNEGQSPGMVAKLLGVPKSAVIRQTGRLVELKVLRLERSLWGTRFYIGSEPECDGPNESE
jgi:predicted transcriptional regulator